jgi:ribosomal protein S18 acetylase RimI-like enzyme
MSAQGWTVRRAQTADLDAVSVLAAKLVRFHHELDPQRYLLAERVRDGYRWWLGEEIGKTDRVVLMVAARHAPSEVEIGGYALGRLEERDWMRLLDTHGELHDVWVEESLRGTGIAEQLVRACVEELEALGAPRIVLNTAWLNERGRHFFGKLGFRPTMLEMTRISAGSKAYDERR